RRADGSRLRRAAVQGSRPVGPQMDVLGDAGRRPSRDLGRRPAGGVAVDDLGLDREALIGLYRSMLVTRRLEEAGHTLYKQGKIPGSFYTGRGNEAASV